MSNNPKSCFQISESHIEGCTFDITSNNQSLYSIGNDDVLCQYFLTGEPKINNISNPNSHQLCKIAYNSKQNKFAVGTHEGSVFELQNDSGNFVVDSSKTLYKSLIGSSDSKVRSLVFTEDGKFLIIGTNEPYCIVYEWQKKRFFKHKLESQTQIASIIVDHRNRYICVIDCDGKASIYEIVQHEAVQKMEIQNNSDSEDPFAELDAYYKPKELSLLGSYKITRQNTNIFKKKYSIMASFNYSLAFMTETLYLPGQTTLQKVELSIPPADFTIQYQLCTNILHSTEIHQAIWLKHEKCGLILTGTETQAALWHEQKGQKLMNFYIESLLGADRLIKNICVRKHSDITTWGFAIIAKSINEQEGIQCKVYDFKAFEQLDTQIDKKETQQISQGQNLNQDLIPMEQSRNKAKKKKQPVKEQSIASKLLLSYLELSLASGYERREGDNARFLFYNNIGCIIERFDAQNESLLQLEFHDRSKISRIKIPAENIFQYFALCSDTFVYASNNKLHIQCEKHLKDGFQWEYEWEEIEGVAIGGQWICAVNKGQIKVWDWVGNELHSVAFDRRYVCMAAYQDLIAIVYHSSLPMWGGQSYKMLIFQVNSKKIKWIRDTLLPTKPTIALKWFGFSEDGMLCCKDQGQNLRVYMFERDQWIPTIAWDPMVERLFIQHIQNYEIYGFRLDQRFPSEPRVMPRSLPRKVPFDLSNFKLDYLSSEQNEYIKRHKLSLMWIEHQKFRNARWYKHKYSRNRDNRWYLRTESIKNEQEIKANQAQMDLKLLDYFKKYMKLNKDKADTTLWRKVLLLCSSLAFYNETRSKLNEVLAQSEILPKPQKDAGMLICPQYNREIKLRTKKAISQLDRLEEMMGLSWFNIREEVSDIQI